LKSSEKIRGGLLIARISKEIARAVGDTSRCCLAPPGTPVFLGISGKESKAISAIGNEFGNARTPVLQSEDVPASLLFYR
jgi:hypothetical protein